jgi:hypothetical protein
MYNISKKMMVGLLVVGIASAQLFSADERGAAAKRRRIGHSAGIETFVDKVRSAAKERDRCKTAFNEKTVGDVTPEFKALDEADQKLKNYLLKTCTNGDYDAFLEVIKYFDECEHKSLFTGNCKNTDACWGFYGKPRVFLTEAVVAQSTPIVDFITKCFKQCQTYVREDADYLGRVALYEAAEIMLKANDGEEYQTASEILEMIVSTGVIFAGSSCFFQFDTTLVSARSSLGKIMEMSAQQGRWDRLEKVIRLGAHRITDCFQELLFHAALTSPEVFEMVSGGICVNPGVRRKTALMKSVEANNPAAVKLLLLRGANPSYEDKIGRTALDYIQDGPNFSEIRGLLEEAAIAQTS